MSAEIEYLILEHLKAIRGSQAAMQADLRDIKTRLLAMESYQAAHHIDAVRQSTRLDDLDARLSRVEVRLDLAE